jgi:FAD-dependent urate hydroxylase
LREVDAQVEIISRSPIIRWLSYGEANYRERTVTQRNLRPPGALGPLGISWIVQIPELFRALPESAKPFIFARAARPAGTGWLRDRVNGVVYTVNESIESVAIESEKLRLALTSGGTRAVDHLVLGSGYEMRVERYRFLSPEIVANIGTRHGQPDLALGFESSIDGLYFIGPGSQQSFGPLLHSVAGTTYAGKSVSRAIKKADLARRYSSPPISLPSISGVSVSTGRGQ